VLGSSRNPSKVLRKVLRDGSTFNATHRTYGQWFEHKWCTGAPSERRDAATATSGIGARFDLRSWNFRAMVPVGT
jgi:hypothetical protein